MLTFLTYCSAIRFLKVKVKNILKDFFLFNVFLQFQKYFQLSNILNFVNFLISMQKNERKLT
jgi:hypothetical protein